VLNKHYSQLYYFEIPLFYNSDNFNKKKQKKKKLIKNFNFKKEELTPRSEAYFSSLLQTLPELALALEKVYLTTYIKFILYIKYHKI